MPVLSLHIKILIECGLITIKSKDRDRYFVADLEKLVEVSQWIEQCRTFWTNKLDALKIYLGDMEEIDNEVKFEK